MIYEQRLEHIPPTGKNAQTDKAKQDEPENTTQIDEEEDVPPELAEELENADQPEEDMIVDHTDDIPDEGL